MKKGRELLLIPLLAFALLIMVLAGPLNARAASTPLMGVHVSQIKTAQLAQPNVNNLLYHGGPVMGGTAHVFAIFWEPTGSFVSANYNSLITRYFNDIGGSSLYHNNTQYHDSGGHFASSAVLSGTFVDKIAYPANPISDTQVRAEVSRAQSINHWASGIGNIFFVFTAKNENICINSSTCSFTTFCAYHSFFGTNTIYAAMPYTGTSLAGCGTPVSPNHDFDSDSTINVTSHEQNEAATDPLLNAWFDATGQEIGDKCNFNFGPTLPSGGDVVFNGHPYEVQKEWDNLKQTCVLAGP
ncbi:MAG TPA: hypothetical protein VKY19_05950 [Ktedonosporobacter sp.]|jgi:hypothetical protein|nr:hypothetical protein [Ktedonosporobacter sp.]